MPQQRTEGGEPSAPATPGLLLLSYTTPRDAASEVEIEYGVAGSPSDWHSIHFETEVRFKREQWSNGLIPREFEQNLPFIYARAFLYAIDSFAKFLAILVQEDNAPEELAKFHAQFNYTFPHLRGVRNTAQHLEDRARGLGAGRNPQPLDLKPITNSLINAPGGGVLALNCLNGSKYGSTMSDGHYGEVDVSPESLEVLQTILQGVLDSFNWRGPKQHAPSM